MVMCWLRPVALSEAVTFRMPLASISKVTSICGIPRGAGGMPSRMNLPSDLVIGRHRAFALQDMDFYLRLAIGGGGEDLALAGGDGGIALDQRGGHAAQGFDREGQRGDIQQQDIL